MAQHSQECDKERFWKCVTAHHPHGLVGASKPSASSAYPLLRQGICLPNTSLSTGTTATEDWHPTVLAVTKYIVPI